MCQRKLMTSHSLATARQDQIIVVVYKCVCTVCARMLGFDQYVNFVAKIKLLDYFTGIFC